MSNFRLSSTFSNLGMKRMAMAKQNSLDDVGLDLDDADDDFEDTPDSGNLEGFGKDSPRPGTPITVEGMHFQVFIYRISLWVVLGQSRFCN